MLRPNGVDNTQQKGRFRLAAASLGDATRLGNLMRHALLERVGGMAVTSVKIDGVTHEFQAVSGAREDVLQVTDRIRRIRIRCSGDRVTGVLDSSSEVVTAGEIALEGGDVADPQLVLAHLSPGARLRLELLFERGVGFRPVEDAPDGFLPVDADFSPVGLITAHKRNERRTGTKRLDR